MAQCDSFPRAWAVTPSDAVNYTQGEAYGFIVGVAGNVVAIVGGTAVTIAAAAGVVIPIRHTRINATSTTATGITAVSY